MHVNGTNPTNMHAHTHTHNTINTKQANNTTSTTNNLMLIQLVLKTPLRPEPEEFQYKYWNQINERPGLQRITYVAKEDYWNSQNWLE